MQKDNSVFFVFMAPLWVPLVQELIYSPASDLLVDRNTKHSICFLHFLQKMFFNYVSQRKCPSRYFAMKVAWSWRKGRWGMSRHTLNRRSHSFFSFAEHVWLYLVTTWDLTYRGGWPKSMCGKHWMCFTDDKRISPQGPLGTLEVWSHLSKTQM